MTDPHGKFVWFELMTTDTAAAGDFYTSVIGWTAEPVGTTLDGTPYIRFSAAGNGVGGMLAMPADVSAARGHPGWMGYIWVNDVDTAAARVTAAGGHIHKGPADIPTVGRFAVAADPQGAVFVLFRHSGDQQGPDIPPGTPGHIGWVELHAGERESAFAFYASQFGWTKTDALDMGGPVGIYQLFATGPADSEAPFGGAVGGIMTKMAHTPAPVWRYYFCVADIDAAIAKVASGGGQVVNGPHQVPGGSWVVQARDPQGAMFALVASHR